MTNIWNSKSKSFVYGDLAPLYVTKKYEVRIVYDHKFELDDYGIVNIATSVIENFCNNLSRARFLADEATKLEVEGYKDPTDGLLEALRAAQEEREERVPGERKLS
jgi:hypothetical protein